MKIVATDPSKALPGGLLRIFVEGLESPVGLEVRIGDQLAEVVGATPDKITVRIPFADQGGISINEQVEYPLEVGQVFASDLHPVGNPVIDVLGNIYVTYSGARGEDVPFGVYKVTPKGQKEPFLGDIQNPTGLAIGPDQFLYISSRHTGTVFRSTFDKQVEKFAEGLGIATGMIFDSKGNLLVGDRGGNIFKVTPEGEKSVLSEIEPSVSAYHLAIDEEDHLYVTGPTLATQDIVYRIDPKGKVETYFKGLGRPQGVAFNRQGQLRVAGSFQGRKGIYAINDREATLLIASTMMVGLAFDSNSDYLYLVDNEYLYRINQV